MGIENEGRKKFNDHNKAPGPDGLNNDGIINRRAFLAGTVFGGIGATIGAQAGIRDAIQAHNSAESIRERIFTPSFIAELKVETGASDADIAKLELDLIIHAKERLHTLIK